VNVCVTVKVANTEGAVGFMVGKWDGRTVDGSMVGRSEGMMVDGVREGSNEGSEDGSTVGSLEGKNVVAIVGDGEICFDHGSDIIMVDAADEPDTLHLIAVQ